MDWKAELKQYKLEYIKHKSPGFYELSGGAKMKTKPYNDTTTNGLTNAVCDWLKYLGHYANRISSTGLMRKINGKMQYTHGASNLGTADIDAIINGKPIKIEIKNVNTRDRMSKHQNQEQARIEAAGGVYVVVPDMQTFVDWYTKFITNNSLQDGKERESTIAC